MCIGQTILWPFRSWRRELVTERGRRLTQSQTLGVVTHVDLFPVEDHLQLLRECRVETHPRHESCEWDKRRMLEFHHYFIGHVNILLL